SQERTMAHWRLDGSRALMQDTSNVRQSRRFQRRKSSRAQPPLRRPGARNERHAQWPLTVKDSAVWFGISDLQRLRSDLDSSERANGDPGDPYLHARLDRRRRRWTDAPARGTTRISACYPRTDYIATGGCERSGRSLATDHAVPPRTRGPRPLTPGSADS